MESKHPQQYVAEQLASAVRAVHGVTAAPGVSRTEPQFGDFQTNVAMQLAKELGQAPGDIAEPVAAKLQTGQHIQTAEVAGPGFINISLNDAFWRQYIDRIGEDFGRGSLGQGQKAQVEFISANPTGPLTLGNARGGFIGDVLSNVLDVQGYEVTREYYFNDAGTQINKLADAVWQKMQMKETPEGTEISYSDVEYAGDYLGEVAERVGGGGFEDPRDPGFKQAITEDIFEHYIKPALDKARIIFDQYTNERDINEHLPYVRDQLKQQDLIEEKDGALWLKSTAFGDERDRVLVKSNGDITYLANDIAYHWDIFANRGFDKAIKVWGADHAGQVPSLQKTLHYLFPDKSLEFLIVQWVRLIKDGQEFKISKRAGTYVTVDELIERVGADVARWFMLMRSNDTHMDFDLDLAAEQSQKNPFWYVMYAYVRANSIMHEASEQGMEPADQISQLNATEREIVKKLSRLPELLEEIARDYQVHQLTFYGRELAKLFHDWYEKVRVVDLPAEEAAEKLYFLQRFIRCMDAYWRVLGIEPHQKM